MEKGFVYIDEVMHGIRWDAKYATWDNFTGRPVDGCNVNRIVASTAMVEALLLAQAEAAALGYGLLLWDAYRPQRAVDCFVCWANQPEDGRTKETHYPNIDRGEMLTNGYVTPTSGHSRGCAVDLTLYRLDTNDLLPMGTCFDFMDERSHHASKGITGEEAHNRQVLSSIMEKSGFEPYAYEWWHYKLKDEPYPGRFFDFPIGE